LTISGNSFRWVAQELGGIGLELVSDGANINTNIAISDHTNYNSGNATFPSYPITCANVNNLKIRGLNSVDDRGLADSGAFRNIRVLDCSGHLIITDCYINGNRSADNAEAKNAIRKEGTTTELIGWDDIVNTIDTAGFVATNAMVQAV
ncbi:unnamed protein product, partial [marine sediment metagenome]